MDTFYRADQYPEKFGVDDVVDEGYWAENNPATIAANAPERLRDLAIMIEAGTEDGFELHRGAEFLHRVLWDRGLKHEYRTVLGADHIGRSLNERFRYACAFISRQWNPERWTRTWWSSGSSSPPSVARPAWIDRAAHGKPEAFRVSSHRSHTTGRGHAVAPRDHSAHR